MTVKKEARAPRPAPAWLPSWAFLAICCMAQFMVVLDVSIVNVALPAMCHDLGLSVTAEQWVVNAYTLTFAGLLMLGGRAAVGSGYLAHILGPGVLVGVGLGLSFVPMTMSATAGVPSAQAGLASGLLNTSRQVGGAVGRAAMATIAASVAHSQGPATALSTALTNGYERAFAVSAAILVVGTALALLLPSPAREAPAPAPAVDEVPSVMVAAEA